MATLLLAPVIAGANAFWGAALTMAAGAIDSWLFSPKAPDVQGQRMDSLQLQDSSYGGMIPIAFGRVRLSGNIIFASDFVEHEHKESVGGKGGRRRQTVTSYTYSISFAAALAKGPIAGIGRIWADGKVIATGENNKNKNMRIYLGREDQMPDPYIEAHNGGAGTTPAYRGLAYIVFQDFELKDFGNRIPQMQFEIFTLDEYVTGILKAPVDTSQQTRYENLLMRRSVFASEDFDNAYFYNCDMAYSSLCVAGIADDESKNRKVVVFEKCDMTGLHAYVSAFGRCDFIECKLDKMSLDISVIGCTEYEYELENAGCTKFEYVAQIIKCSLTELRLHLSNFFNVKFQNCDMKNLNHVYGGSFCHCLFDTCDFSGIIFKDFFLRCIFKNCKFNGATVIGFGYQKETKLEDVIDEIKKEIESEFIDCDFYTIPETVVQNISNQYPLQSIIAKLGEYAKIPADKLSFSLGPSEGNAHKSLLTPERQTVVLDLYDVLGDLFRYNSGDYDSFNPDYYPYALYYTLISTILDDREGFTGTALPLNGGIMRYVDGYLITSQITFRQAVEDLQAPFLFNVVDDGSKLCFTMMGMETQVDIPEDDFGAINVSEETADKLTIIGGDVSSLPTQINVNYFDIAKDYQSNTVMSRILWHNEQPNPQTITTKIVTDKAYAAHIASQALSQTWINKTKYTGQLGNKWSRLEPSDVIRTVVNGIRRAIQLTKLDYDGKLVKFEGKEYKAPASAPEYERYEPILPPPIVPVGLECELFDLPNLTGVETEEGVYAAAAAKEDWQTVYLFVAENADYSSYSLLSDIQVMAAMGRAITALPPGPIDFFDRGNFVEVKLIGKTLESVSEDDLLLNCNAALLGSEVIQFAQAELIAENTYRLSCLLRGRKGTDWAVGSHAAGERFLLLNAGTLMPETAVLADIGRRKRYKYRIYNDDEGAVFDFTYRGVCYKPYSVCHVSGTRNAVGDVEIVWTRRTRIGGEWRDGVDAALSEAYECYEVDIIKDTEPVRTIKTEQPTATYSASAQTDDFGTPQSAITVRIYQLSDKVGRGYVKEAII